MAVGKQQGLLCNSCTFLTPRCRHGCVRGAKNESFITDLLLPNDKDHFKAHIYDRERADTWNLSQNLWCFSEDKVEISGVWCSKLTGVLHLHTVNKHIHKATSTTNMSSPFRWPRKLPADWRHSADGTRHCPEDRKQNLRGGRQRGVRQNRFQAAQTGSGTLGARSLLCHLIPQHAALTFSQQDLLVSLSLSLHSLFSHREKKKCVNCALFLDLSCELLFLHSISTLLKLLPEMGFSETVIHRALKPLSVQFCYILQHICALQICSYPDVCSVTRSLTVRQTLWSTRWPRLSRNSSPKMPRTMRLKTQRAMGKPAGRSRATRVQTRPR